METDPGAHRFALDSLVRYEIRIAGHVTGEWTEWLDADVHKEPCGTRDAPQTVIVGVFDQAALHGVLRRLYSLGFPLIAVSSNGPVPSG